MKNTLLFIVKAAVSLALIWYLLSKAEFSAVYASLKSAGLFWLFMAFFTLYVGKILTGYRWQVLLEAQGIKIPLRTLVASLFVGQFFNSFLPTTVGGDAIRAFDTASHSKESAKSFTTVFVDRMVGVLALVLLAFLAIIAGILIGEDVSFYIWPVLGVFIGTVVGFIVIFNSKLAAWVEATLMKFRLAKVANKVGKAVQSLHILKGNRHTLLAAFLVSIGLQVNVVLFHYFISLSLGLPVSLLYYFIIVPVVLTILIVPFSINGIGLREGIFTILLANLAVPAQDAIALSLLSFVLALTQGVIGGFIFALRGINLRRLKMKTNN